MERGTNLQNSKKNVLRLPGSAKLDTDNESGFLNHVVVFVFLKASFLTKVEYLI